MLDRADHTSGIQVASTAEDAAILARSLVDPCGIVTRALITSGLSCVGVTWQTGFSWPGVSDRQHGVTWVSRQAVERIHAVNRPDQADLVN
jgi:hypothetical protein